MMEKVFVRSSFFKGVPLRCPWCANPESQVIQSHFMYDERLCTHCHSCLDTCVKNAISFCGEKRSVDDLMHEILLDKEYYEASHGGVTISGGKYPLDKLKKAYPYIDMFYFDVKYLNETKYNKTVHGNLQQVQQNLAYIIDKNPQLSSFEPLLILLTVNTTSKLC